jgi:hypothetical protein
MAKRKALIRAKRRRAIRSSADERDRYKRLTYEEDHESSTSCND